MRKNNNKKGFTIVELVIVIAVIAILAAVLIPTFSGAINKANDSAALQEARNTYTEYLAKVNAQPADVVYVQGGDQYFKFEDGKINETPVAESALGTVNGSVKVTMTNNVITVNCLGGHTWENGDAAGTKCDDCDATKS